MKRRGWRGVALVYDLWDMRYDFYFLPTYNFGNLKTFYDFLMMIRETEERLYFSFSVGLDVSKIFSPHYTGVGPYIVVSRITINLYIRDNITSLLTTVFGCSFVVFVVVMVVIAVFVVTNFNFCFTTVRLSFSGCGFLFV